MGEAGCPKCRSRPTVQSVVPIRSGFEYLTLRCTTCGLVYDAQMPRRKLKPSKPNRDRETSSPARSVLQIRTLIDSIGVCVQSLNYDIEAEEERSRCWDCRDTAYSTLARSLTARRDNLAETIAALQRRLFGQRHMARPGILFEADA
jgi:hypothetical protein